MKIELKDGVMQVDPVELFHALSDEKKIEVARMIAFSEHMQARQRLLPLMPEIMRTIITELINQRDTADKRENQWQSHCFELQRRWNDAKMPDRDIDYFRAPRLTADQVEQLIEKWKSEAAHD